VLEIEVQGARQVRDALGGDAVLIFIAPPDEAVLRERLEMRGTDSREDIEQRLRTAEVELAARSEFPLEVVNDDLQKAASDLEGLVRDQLALH
jgi:guanylate kinase